MASTPSLARLATSPQPLAQGQPVSSPTPQWIHAFVELPEGLEWMRLRLELALFDAQERRLNGLIGQYRALRRLGEASLPTNLYEGYRQLGSLLVEAGQSEMGGQALQIASLLDDWLLEGVSQTEMESHGTAFA